VLAVSLLDGRAHLLLETTDLRAQTGDLVLQRQDALDAGEVEPELVRQVLDRP
jgi:hypothetical protein